MLSGTLLSGDDVSARFRIDDGIAPCELRRFVRLAVSLPIGVTPLNGNVSATGRVVRNVADGSGVNFDSIDADTQRMLDGFVLGARHQLAQRFAQVAG